MLLLGSIVPLARCTLPIDPDAIEPETTAAFPISPLITAPEAMCKLLIPPEAIPIVSAPLG